jgi:hypothetical protein
MERKPIGPEAVIEDLYNNQITSLMDEIHKVISLKEYQHDDSWVYIYVTVNKSNYNPVVLNEVKRRYLLEGWGNIFYKIEGDKITFQLYFPQMNK